MQQQKQKQWIPKDKGKMTEVENKQDVEGSSKDDDWTQPKKATASAIQVGNLFVPTSNAFEELHINEEGGDLFPNSGT